jgi:hypothetical protein
MCGKSFLDAGLILDFLFSRPNSLVIATAASQVQLEEVLWKEVEVAYSGARVPLGGRILRSPLKVDLGGGWNCLAYSTSKCERFAGHHRNDLFAVLDEASGVPDEICEAVSGLNPSCELWTGNPLRPLGTFYDRCRSAPDNPLANLIHISSLESPHIDLARSPWGLADRTWLEKSWNDYGKGSLWERCHILGMFPEEGFDQVIPAAWLDLAERAIRVPSGKPRIAIDLGLGNGGDNSVIMAKDDNGLLAVEHSNRWTLEVTASRAALMAQRLGVPGSRVSWDVASIGADFANRLKAFGLHGCRPYLGGAVGTNRFANLRTVAAWAARQRLDPKRRVDNPALGNLLYSQDVMITQRPFAIPARFMAPLRAELRELRYELLPADKVALEDAESYAKRLKHSPDFASAFTQLFAFDRVAA